MRCTTCGAKNTPDAGYCVNCGVPLEEQPSGEGEVTYCTSCGTGIPQGSMSCSSCGAALQARPRGGGTPELAPSRVDVEYMGFWIRLLAAVIDTVILVVITLVLGAISGGLSFAIQWLINILYHVLFTGLKGQTPGKMLVGIQVLTRDGAVPGIGRVLLREVVGKVVSTFVLLIGYLWIAFDPHKQGWHDKIASTYVIRKAR